MEERYIVFSDWSGWCSRPMSSDEQLDFSYPANVHTARMPAAFVEAFCQSVRQHAEDGSPIDWSHASEV